MSSHNPRTFSFGSRLTVMMTGLVLISVVSIASIMYLSYKQSFERVTLTELEVTGDLSVKSFLQWAQARQDEMAYLASLDAARFGDLAQLEHLMQRITESQGFYDTIFLVDTSGFGVIGVEYDGQARVMPPEEAQAFAVADREWFQQAMRGQ
ncbi:MAG: methyl-accepting chemotaxis protein, partial [Pseudohongiella sp.]|nr:methyl-accepting chemotaxis protein [Pseudohongiella sp.]